MKFVLASMLFFNVFNPSFAFAKERQHQIKLIGQVDSKMNSLTVEMIEKEVKSKAQLETSLQGEPKQKFEGVFVKDFLAQYGPSTTKKIKITAINNYSQILSEKDWIEWNAILAFKSDGKIIPTKNRGTFRVIYDYEKFKNSPNLITVETNSVWQITEIVFLKD